MKKIFFSLCMLFLFTLCTFFPFSIGVFNDYLIQTDIKKYNDFEMINSNRKQKKYNQEEMEVLEISEKIEIIKSQIQSVTSDILEEIESNNDFSSAQNISLLNDNSFPLSSNVALTIKGSLYGQNTPFNSDVDIFQFDVFSNGTIYGIFENIQLDYQIELYKLSNDDPNNYRPIYIDKGYSASSPTKYIMANINAGTYFLKLYNSSRNLNYTNVQYNLQFSMTLENETEYDLTQYKYLYGEKGAVWRSNFDFLGIKPLTRFDKTLLQSETSNLDFNFKDYVDIGVRYPYASIYVWDVELRNFLSTLLKQTADTIEAEVGEATKIKLQYEARFNTFTNNWDIFLTIIEYAADLNPITSLLMSTMSDFAISFIENEIDDIINEEDYLDSIDIIRYLDVASEKLNYTGYDGEDKEIIRLDTFFTISEENGDYYIDFELNRDDCFVIMPSDNRMVVSRPNNSLIVGKLYPLSNNNDVENMFEMKTRDLNYVNTSSGSNGYYTDVKLDEVINGSLDTNEYRYYKFVAPKDDIYYFENKSAFHVRCDLMNLMDANPNSDECFASKSIYTINGISILGSSYKQSITINLTQNQVVYIRLNAFNLSSISYSLVVKNNLSNDGSDGNPGILPPIIINPIFPINA